MSRHQNNHLSSSRKAPALPTLQKLGAPVARYPQMKNTRNRSTGGCSAESSIAFSPANSQDLVVSGLFGACVSEMMPKTDVKRVSLFGSQHYQETTVYPYFNSLQSASQCLCNIPNGVLKDAEKKEPSWFPMLGGFCALNEPPDKVTSQMLVLKLLEIAGEKSNGESLKNNEHFVLSCFIACLLHSDLSRDQHLALALSKYKVARVVKHTQFQDEHIFVDMVRSNAKGEARITLKQLVSQSEQELMSVTFADANGCVADPVIIAAKRQIQSNYHYFSNMVIYRDDSRWLANLAAVYDEKAGKLKYQLDSPQIAPGVKEDVVQHRRVLHALKIILMSFCDQKLELVFPGDQ